MDLEIIESRDFINGKITVYNDGKEKRSSWEARMLIETNVDGGNIYIDVVKYGYTKVDAIEELYSTYNTLLDKFQEDFCKGLK